MHSCALLIGTDTQEGADIFIAPQDSDRREEEEEEEKIMTDRVGIKIDFYF